MSNPLLNYTGLPAFSQIKPEHIQPAVEAVIKECRETVEAVAKIENPTWENFYLPQAIAGDKFSRAWSPVGHLNAVKNSQNCVKLIRLACHYYLNTALGLGNIKAYIKAM